MCDLCIALNDNFDKSVAISFACKYELSDPIVFIDISSNSVRAVQFCIKLTERFRTHVYDRIPSTVPHAKKDDKSDAKKIEIVKIFNSNKIIPDIRKDTNTVRLQ